MSDKLSKSIFEEDIVIDDFIRDDFMGEIFSNISDILDDKYVSSFEIPVATHMAMLKIQKMIDLALINHDGEYSPTEPLEVLRPDAEPIPSMIDSWARGTVKIKKISKLQARERFMVHGSWVALGHGPQAGDRLSFTCRKFMYV